MDKKLIERKLHDYAGQAVPPGTDLWPRLVARLDVSPGDSRPIGHPGSNNAKPASADSVSTRAGGLRVVVAAKLFAGRAQRSPNLAFAALATMLLLGVAGVALLLGQAPTPDRQPAVVPTTDKQPTPTATPPFNYTALWNTGLSHIARLSTTLNLSATQGLYTVNLHAAYADANMVALIYSIQGPKGESLTPVGNIVKDYAFGNDRLTPLFGGQSATPELYALAFAAPAEAARSKSLNLQFAVELNRLAPGTQPPSLFPQPDLAAAWLTKGGLMTASNATANIGGTRVAGDFAFKFAVPVTAAGTSIITPNASAESGGVPMTLEQVIVSPGATQAILRYKHPNDYPVPWLPMVDLRAGDFSSLAPESWGITSSLRKLEGDRWSYTIFTPLADKSGKWALNVFQLQHGTNPVPSEIMIGPWLFKFEVPATGK